MARYQDFVGFHDDDDDDSTDFLQHIKIPGIERINHFVSIFFH